MNNFVNQSRCTFRVVLSAAFSTISLSGVGLYAGVMDPLPKQLDEKFIQAVDLLGKGRLAEADTLLGQVTEDNPQLLDATLGRAQIAVSQQRLDQADSLVTQVLARQDNLPEAHNMKGVVLLLKKRTDEARSQFSRAVELRPRYVTPRLYLAILSRFSGDYAGAIAQYKALIGVAPRLPAGYLGQAESQMLLHQQAAALETLEGWKAADPNTLMPYQVLANIYLAGKDSPKAIAQLQAALKKRPDDPATTTILGTAYAVAGNTSSAMSTYRKAMAIKDANAEPSLRLGELEAQQGQTREALAHFRQSLKIDPNNAVASNNIAWLLANQGSELDEALRLAELTTQRDPKYVDAQDTLGWVRYRRGEYPQAAAAFKAALALAPSRTDIAAHLSLVSGGEAQKHNTPAIPVRQPWLWTVVGIFAVSLAALALRLVWKSRRSVAARGVAPEAFSSPQTRG